MHINTVTRLLPILITLASLLPYSVIAQEEVPWFSLSRLSLTASSSYHFSPWKKYNESLQLAQDAIRYDPGYKNPQGSLEKILGDGTIELSAGYRLIEGLSVNVVGGFTSTSSQLTFSNIEQRILYPEQTFFSAENSINQKIILDVKRVGLGLQYNFEVIDGIQFVALVNGHKNYATVNFEYEHAYHYELDGSSTRDVFSSELRDSRIGFNAGLGASIKAYGPISFNLLVEYRWLKFPDLQGNGTYIQQNNRPTYYYEEGREFRASLGEGNGYFTLEIEGEDKWYTNSYLLYRLWSGAEAGPWGVKRSPATIDLSGVGIKIGVRYGF